MTWTVDPPIQMGQASFAAISEIEVLAHQIGRTVLGSARKNPKLVLMCVRGRVSATDFAGNNFDALEVERRYPGAIVQMKALLDKRHTDRTDPV
ncbi:hypothetical protein [Roseovarius rhodophyticola]|uniref:Uncharacterized protein n=1 Tax=Roseovarius rhodophyticola TaxID=3080827 RepID=A0ABZ2TG03_9RHOB|nr:hypothetical protein [Roseovarius sp. W115]MDV2928272.1 hypothetical protein [Roseovarius sp. W115]